MTNEELKNIPVPPEIDIRNAPSPVTQKLLRELGTGGDGSPWEHDEQCPLWGGPGPSDIYRRCTCERP